MLCRVIYVSFLKISCVILCHLTFAFTLLKSLDYGRHGANVLVSSWQRYLHASSEWAPVFGLTAAFAAASMIPTSGVLREVSDNTQATTKNGEGVEVLGLKSES